VEAQLRKAALGSIDDRFSATELLLKINLSHEFRFCPKNYWLSIYAILSRKHLLGFVLTDPIPQKRMATQ
jgi:hypothetical protein